MHHITTHNIGLGSYNDDFNRLMKDLLMKDHSVKAFYTCYSSVKYIETSDKTTSKFIEKD